jgi:transcriptional regulator with XRE-family HTH domain
MAPYPAEAWRRLGRMLERRRGELGYGFRQRARFARECGGGLISVKTISRLENGERDSYPESTVGTVEAIYQWSPGSIESVLMGGDPNPLLPTSPAARNPITSPDAPPTGGERIAMWVHVRMSQRGHSDDAIHDFLEAEGLPREPTTISAVSRIAGATGATVAEVLALLGVEDNSSRRTLRPVPAGEDQVSADQVTSATGQADTQSS